MAIGDTWRRALEYFGLVEGDYIEEGQYTDEHDDVGGASRTRGGGGGGGEGPDTMADAPIREPRTSRGASRGRGDFGGDDVDDIFGDEMPSRRGRTAVEEAPPDLEPAEPRGGGRGNGADVQMKLVAPRNFNDAQQVADEFKSRRPVILNLQDTNADLSRRLIDFCSGLTYALGGGMQKIATQTFLLTPENVQVSAAEAERMLERGFFNQS